MNTQTSDKMAQNLHFKTIFWPTLTSKLEYLWSNFRRFFLRQVLTFLAIGTNQKSLLPVPPSLNQVAEADGLLLGIAICTAFRKILPFLVQHQQPGGILALEQPLHADKDSAKVSDTPH